MSTPTLNLSLMIFPRLVLSAALCTGLNAVGFVSISLISMAAEPFLLAQDSAAETQPVERPTLAVGSSGPLVIELQLRLKAIAFYEGEVTGDFGETTRLAVEAFQREYGIEVTGSATPETWQALENPATAKLEAALEAEGDRTEAETGGSEAGESPADASPADTSQNEAGQAAPDGAVPTALPRSPTDWAVMAAAFAGLGLGGFGLWKALRPRLRHKRKKGSPRRAAPLVLPPQVSGPGREDSEMGTVNPWDSPTSHSPGAHDKLTDLAAGTPANGTPVASSASQPATKGNASSSLAAANFPLVSGAGALIPPPPPSAIQKKVEATPLSPTTRLTRTDPVEQLMGQLQSTDPTLRRKAVWELGQRGDSRAIQPLVNLMTLSDSKQRSLILAALSEIGTQTLKPMKRALAMSLQDSNAEVRKNAIRDLTRIYDLVAQISSLLAIATEDEDPEVRETARWALGQLNRIRSNAGLDPAENQQLLKQSVSPPETFSDEFHAEDLHLGSTGRESNLK